MHSNPPVGVFIDPHPHHGGHGAQQVRSQARHRFLTWDRNHLGQGREEACKALGKGLEAWHGTGKLAFPKMFSELFRNPTPHLVEGGGFRDTPIRIIPDNGRASLILVHIILTQLTKDFI